MFSKSSFKAEDRNIIKLPLDLENGFDAMDVGPQNNNNNNNNNNNKHEVPYPPSHSSMHTINSIPLSLSLSLQV